MKNKIQSGHTITVSRSALSVSGLPYDLGSGLIGTAVADYAANEAGEYELSGVKEFDKRSADVYAVGDIIDWDNGNLESVTDGDAASDHELGICIAPAAGGVLKVRVIVGSKLGPGPSFS